MSGERGGVTHTEDGEHVATCSEPGCTWKYATKVDGQAAHELMEHEHEFGTPDVLGGLQDELKKDDLWYLDEEERRGSPW
jgi:hypothetical protein